MGDVPKILLTRPFAGTVRGADCGPARHRGVAARHRNRCRGHEGGGGRVGEAAEDGRGEVSKLLTET